MKDSLKTMVKSLALTNPVVVPYMLQSTIDVSGYSSLDKMLRVTAVCLRFVNNFKRGTGKKNWHLNPNGLTAVRRIWIQSIQGNVFSDVTFNRDRESLGVYRCED